MMIAMALSCDPSLLIADEPTTALDVTIQAQILDLLRSLQAKNNMSVLLITHDLGVVAEMADEVCVMYASKIVERAEVHELFSHPLHPYTQALLSAVPIPNPGKERNRQRIILEGDVPSPVNPPAGCRFNPRCPLVTEECTVVDPEWREVITDHWVACHEVSGA